jgi:hypothetical protein
VAALLIHPQIHLDPAVVCKPPQIIQ